MTGVDRRSPVTWVILLVVLHTWGVGVLLLAFPEWGTRFGGWDTVTPLFFVRQAGVFHLLIGTAYLMEWVRLRSVLLLLMAKTVAVLFLTGTLFLDGASWAVYVSAAADAAMAVGVWLVYRRFRAA